MANLLTIFSLHWRKFSEDIHYKLVSVSLLFMFFTVPYWFALNYIDSLTSMYPGSPFLSWFTWTTIIQSILRMITILAFVFLYWLEHPFFEQYKDNDIPWPWKVETGFWRKIMKGSSLILFNIFILRPLTSYVVDDLL